MQAVILSIGDELVLGQTVDTNSGWLSAQLVRRGIGTLYHQTVADDQEAIAKALRQAAEAAELVLVSGGLGPTQDDLTRQALAEAMSVELVLDPSSLDAIRTRMERLGRPMPPSNAVQAMHPVGTRMIPNSCGTAPGIQARLDRALVFVAPGPPRELTAMFEQSIGAEIDRLPHERAVILTNKINTFGCGESQVGQMLDALMDRHRNPKVGTTVSGGIVAVRVRSEFTDTEEARRQLDDTVSQVCRRLGGIVFGFQDHTIQESLVDLLKQRQATLVTAESCTGGLLSGMITDVPGSSQVFRGGWVTYSNEMKVSQLAVPVPLIDQHGVVSEAVVRAMADGAIRRSGADLSLAITGIAGPEGGSVEKPVGTVWIGLGVKAGDEIHTEALSFSFVGSRDVVRDRAAKSAVQMLRLHLLDQSLDQLTFGKRSQELKADNTPSRPQ